MELVSWVLGTNTKVSKQAPSTTTPGDKLDTETEACGQDPFSKTKTLGRDAQFTVEELGNGDEMSNADGDSEDGRLDMKARSSDNVQVKISTSTKSAASSRSPSTVELFGGDDTDFLDDFLVEDSAPLKLQRLRQTLPENIKDGGSSEIAKANGYVTENEEKSNGNTASLYSSDAEVENTSEQSILSKSKAKTSGEDDHPKSLINENHEDVIAEQQLPVKEQFVIVEASKAGADPKHSRKHTFSFNWADSNDDEDEFTLLPLMEENIGIVKEDRTKKPVPKPIVKTRLADLDDIDDDDWTASAEWMADQNTVHATNVPIFKVFQGTGQDSKVGTLSARLPSSRPHGSAAYPSLGNGGDVANSILTVRGSIAGTLKSKHPSYMSEYGAGYDGPSRSLDFHQYTNVEQAYRHEEIRRDAEEAYQIQIQNLWERYAADIEALKEPSAITPKEEDLHDEEMRKVFSDICSALPSQKATGIMHIIDWKTLTGPDQTGPDPDHEENFLLHFVKPRLCDAVATVLFESDPSAIDAWLDPSKKVVEWWHSPHYLHRGVTKTVIRRDSNNVTVGTFTDLGFAVCWSHYIKAEIDDDGQWTETYAFQGGQFKKKPGEKEPGASSQKVRGEIDWESFEIGEAKYYDWDELSDPVEALWHGRVLAHTMIRMILNNYSQYRGGNTVELVVDGESTSIEQRGIRRVPRTNGIENDRIEEVVSTPGLFAPSKEDAESSGLLSEESDEVEFEALEC